MDTRAALCGLYQEPGMQRDPARGRSPGYAVPCVRRAAEALLAPPSLIALALLPPPPAGKSTLINALVGDELMPVR